MGISDIFAKNHMQYDFIMVIIENVFQNTKKNYVWQSSIKRSTQIEGDTDKLSFMLFPLFIKKSIDLPKSYLGIIYKEPVY